MKNAIVIGGGFGGIASALRLRAKSYNVTIIERCSNLGGRAQVFSQNGFKHDIGPTVITAPFLFEELFDLFGKNMADYITLVPLDPWYRFVYQDGSIFNYGGSVNDTLNQIEKFNKDDKSGYLRLLEASKEIFDIGFTELADQPFHEISTMIKQVPRLIRLKSYRTVWKHVSAFIKDEKLRQALSIQPLLVGGNPFDTTNIYGLIHYLERKWGVHFAMGGTGAIVKALTDLLNSLGVQVKLNTTVAKVQIKNSKVYGVKLENGREIVADIVVSNADPLHLYGSMIEKKYHPSTLKLKLRKPRLSMGLFVLFFGTTKKYDNIAHHTIWMGPRYRELLDDIFHKKILANDFSLYIHRPTATDQGFAPSGCDSFYVLAPVPNLQAKINWSEEGSKLQTRIINALERSIMPNLKQHICEISFMTPEDFSKNYLSTEGAGFSIAPEFSQSAWFRFHNLGEGVENLFLTGAGTHPGGGLPGVLSSAKVIDKLIPSATSNKVS